MPLRATLTGGAEVFVTTRPDGDYAEAATVPSSWSALRQVHGAHVVSVTSRPTRPFVEGDALVTSEPGVFLAVRGADCPLIGLSSPEGIVAAVHAGWRGLLAGVVEKAAAVMRENGAQEIEAVVGPYVHPECYGFSPKDLDVLVDAFGPMAASQCASGAALDLMACCTVAFARSEIAHVASLGACTGCCDAFYSWRTRGELARHALVISRS